MDPDRVSHLVLQVMQTKWSWTRKVLFSFSDPESLLAGPQESMGKPQPV